jgi:hypothetical protein
LLFSSCDLPWRADAGTAIDAAIGDSTSSPVPIRGATTGVGAPVDVRQPKQRVPLVPQGPGDPIRVTRKPVRFPTGSRLDGALGLRQLVTVFVPILTNS